MTTSALTIQCPSCSSSIADGAACTACGLSLARAERGGRTLRGITRARVPVDLNLVVDIDRTGSSEPFRQGISTLLGSVLDDGRTRLAGLKVTLATHGDLDDGQQLVLMADRKTPEEALEAARTIRGAAHRLVDLAGGSVPTDLMLRSAFKHAADCLRDLGRELQVQRHEDGARTTLMVVAALPDRYELCFIGDGGVFLLRWDGPCESLLRPQRVAGNLLSGSLGPVSVGEPVSLSVDRRPGDLLFVATDGVADVVHQPFFDDVRNMFLGSGGDLDGACRVVVAELEALADQDGPVISDNLTLGMLWTPGDGELSQGQGRSRCSEVR